MCACMCACTRRHALRGRQNGHKDIFHSPGKSVALCISEDVCKRASEVSCFSESVILNQLERIFTVSSDDELRKSLAGSGHVSWHAHV